MKFLSLTAGILMGVSFAAQAQIQRHCQVELVDQFNRVLQSFWGSTNHIGMCQDALRDCNYTRRTRNLMHAQCVSRQLPGGSRGRVPTSQERYYLQLSNHQLLQEALSIRGIGSCQARRGHQFDRCEYYITANHRGYPIASGCSHPVDVRHFCHYRNQRDNAACMIRLAIEEGQCFQSRHSRTQPPRTQPPRSNPRNPAPRPPRF